MRVLKYPEDQARIERLFHRTSTRDAQAEEAVKEILARVRRQGDRAVAYYAKKFDGVQPDPQHGYRVPEADLKKAWEALEPPLQRALKLALKRIRTYHKKQKVQGFTYKDALGNRMDQRVTPLKRVGLYAPGGTAAYPSSVLMNAVPAQVAGVEEIVMLTPPPRPGMESQTITLAAAYIAGVTEVLCVGGAHGVAALALGTESIGQVDMIVGPGNKYVALAKKMLHGEIDIDMVAGPSEVLILADDTASPKLVAADLLSQAEHDTDAQAVAVLIGDCDVAVFQKELRRQTNASPRKEIIRQSLKGQGAFILVRTPEDAIHIANWKAPEHLEILARRARSLAGKIPNVGAIFLGSYTPEPMGDYVAGPNHVLPTGGTARFFSPLSVWSFLKTSHVVECSRRGFETLAEPVLVIAEAEGLMAHAEAVRKRLQD